MGNTYNSLTLSERYHIQALTCHGHSARSIGRDLKRSNKTISSELQRCPTNAYCANTAHQQAQAERKNTTKASKKDESLKSVVLELLTEGFSLEQIAGRMRIEKPSKRVCFQTIYRWIEREGLRTLLPRRGKKRQQRKGKEAGVRLIPERIDIDKRPAIVEEKTEIGHWEGDTVYGQDGYLVTLVERVSKLLLTVRKKTTVSKAIYQLFKPFKAICKTITFDNGGEFADHKKISRKLDCDIFFAKPYCSWQRGLNENTNGLLRRYFPKGMKISDVSTREINNEQLAINTRPRKALNYLSPSEFLTGQRVSFMRGI